jgi:uncharacterized protein (TIGR02271 family)
MTEGRGSERYAERYDRYEVYDRDGDKIGKVDDLFVDENDRPEYIGVKMGLLGLGGSTLVPLEAARVDEERERIEVQAEKQTVKDAPSYGDNEEITPELERRVYEHYGLTYGEAERGAYGDDYESEAATTGSGRTGSTEDELRVGRTEEELRAGTREREAGSVRVRKRVRTDREQIRVPKRREEVSVERVPVEEGGEASEAEIGDDEVSVPVTEEEVVVEKQPVAKEEIRIRKDVVEDEEVVEDEVRKEEIDVDDESERRNR